jgi:hypothetical protein
MKFSDFQLYLWTSEISLSVYGLSEISISESEISESP